MSTSAGAADTATGASGLQALVYTSPMHEFDGARGTFSPTTSTLIVGQREAVLIDAQFMTSDVTALGDMIGDAGKELTAIYITHGHADHHFGLGPLLERFPRARALATPGVIDYITANSENETGLWNAMFGDRFVQPTVVPEPLDGDTIELEDAQLRIIEVGQGDIRPSTVVHVPAIGTVVPGDVVYNRIHVMMALSTPDEWQQWLASIDAVEALSPRSIIAGHKAPDASDEDVRGMLDGTRAYIRDFAAAAPATKDAEELIAVMLEKHPDRRNPWTLQYSANAWFQRQQEPASVAWQDYGYGRYSRNDAEMKIEGSVALVTGANRGLGAEFCRQLLGGGAAKVYGAVRASALLRDDRVVPVRLDVTDRGSIDAAAKTATDVTLLVNNAGIMTGARVLGDEDQLRREVEVNYLGTVAVTRAFAPILAANGGGAVINVLSVLSWLTLPTTGGYSAAKAASWAATNALRHELHENATKVLALHVGFMDTDMTKDVDAPKSAPSDVAAKALDGLEAGEQEVLADDTSRHVKAALAGPPSNLYPTVA